MTEKQFKVHAEGYQDTDDMGYAIAPPVIYYHVGNSKIGFNFDTEREAKMLCEAWNKLVEENEQSNMMITTLRNIVLEQEDLEKENKELDNRLNKYIVDYNGLNCEWHWLKTENEQIKKDLKIMLPLILAIDSKMSIKECKAVNRLCKLVEDDFIKSKEINNLFKKKEYPKRNPITYAAVPEAIYNWDD